jgi:signal peptidase I
MIRILMLMTMITPAMAQTDCPCPACDGITRAGYAISTHSMQPTLRYHQCAVVQMQAADPAEPAAGDIVVFSKPFAMGDDALAEFADVLAHEDTLRVIGLEGDTIRLVAGRLILNDTPVDISPMPPFQQTVPTDGSVHIAPLCPNDVIAASCDIPQDRETLPNGVSYPILNLKSAGPADWVLGVTVPPGHVFLMGDNRDDAYDSRVSADLGGTGLVPVEDIVGIVREIGPLP